MSNAFETKTDDDWPGSLIRYNQKINDIMDIRRWKVLKTMFIGTLVAIVTLFSIEQGADPTVTGPLGIVVIAAVAGVELGELPMLEIAAKQHNGTPKDEDS